MKLIINGNIKPYYIQMLAMLFYPGERFPEGEAADEEARCAEISVALCDGGARAAVRIADGEKTACGEAFLESGILSEDKLIKFTAGAAFLDACRKLTGHVPPWGMLTGVRPARLAAELLEHGMSTEEVVSFFTRVYRTTEQKARIAVTCAEVSKRIVTERSKSECSVYISIPFCPTRCSYCSFVSYTSPKLQSMIPEYLEVLKSDVEDTFALIKELGVRVATVYIGGGTPTVLNEEQLESLLRTVYENTTDLDEFTLEAGRPDTITEGKLSIAKKYGVTRISVNTQTLNDSVLKAIGRAHTADDFLRAYDLAVKSGIRDINVDLIAGLPGDDFDSFKDSLDRVIALDPTNITVHTFSVKKSAELRVEGADVYDREGNVASKCVQYSEDKLLEAGYVPYYMYRQKNTVGNLENVGYSKEGHEGLYNIYMMDEIHSIFASGASSVTKTVSTASDGSLLIERIFEPKYPYEYLSDRNSEEFISKRSEKLSKIRAAYLK